MVKTKIISKSNISLETCKDFEIILPFELLGVLDVRAQLWPVIYNLTVYFKLLALKSL